ncbi:sensor histidine kinase [Streptomyces iranensis]|uniref:histidine kinase n=1 Tax=Streptomyces iranensis TaxID=576784 RepID=A0A060ZNQ2_9ACTN|nr:histidine kinase [Streptomyces iranensis]MBP2062301.1 signal transduction histidine kinase [Streptomyces iranensis]CDR07501.1 two-component system sensor kinase [Streptomyces iranensis]
MLRHDASLQWAVTLLIIAIAVITVRPVGVSGRGLAVVALLVVNSVALLARHLPPAFPRRAALVWLTAGAVASAGLLEVSNSGSGYLFAYFLVGHAGYRLALKPALAVAALSSLLCGAVFYFYVGPDHQVLTWTFGLSTGIPVVAGILGRSRQQAAEARLQAAESAERAEARTAVLTERGRIARDVHDVLAHSLAGINMHLELADALMDTGDLEKVRAAHNKAQSLVRESLKQAQWTVHALREDSLPLLESLTAMIESSGHREVLTVTGAVRELPAQVTQNVLRIAQEALTNAARHAPGAEIAVELAFDAASTSLAVRNGPATGEATAGVGSGMGLIGMRERVALLGGTLTAGPLTGGPDRGGWQVEAVIRG